MDSGARHERLVAVLKLGNAALPSHVWSVLTPEERERALLSEYSAEHDPKVRESNRRHLGAILLKYRAGFRAGTVLGWALEKLCADVSKLTRPDSPLMIERVVLAHHQPLLAETQAPFWDELGLQHHEGDPAEGVLESVASLRTDHLCAAALRAWRARPTRDMAVYFLALVAVYPERWRALGIILPTIAEELEGGVFSRDTAEMAIDWPDVDPHVLTATPPAGAEAISAAATVEVMQEGSALPVQVPLDSEHAVLSPLDDELIRRVADSLQGIQGAPDEVTLDRIIDELIRLNSTRHQSFYHLGFHDAVREREARTLLPAQNLSRWRWYFTGYVAGLMRRNVPDRIIEIFQEREEVRTLGDSGRGPSRYAAFHIFEALSLAERVADVVRFVQPAAVIRHEPLQQGMIEFGRHLQQQMRFADATPVFEVLMKAMSSLPEPDRAAWATVRRRYAHCLREAGQLEAARRELQEVLADSDDIDRAMVLVDLGMIEAGFSRLAGLALPPSFTEAQAMADELSRSRTRLDEAVALDVDKSSHAQYVLGVERLWRRRWAEAEGLLDSAIATFERERVVYSDQLMNRARLHLGVARCANVESHLAQLPKAVNDIVAGMQAGEPLPHCYMTEVIEGLGLRESVHVQPLIEQLLQTGGESLLDTLRNVPNATKVPLVADALANRFRASYRTIEQRMDDGAAALDMLMAQGRHVEAAALLDELEERGLQGSGLVRFLQLVEKPERFTSVWDEIDLLNARVRCLEAGGRYEEAAGLLTSEFHRSINRRDPSGLLQADDILETLKSYPCARSLDLEGLGTRRASAAEDRVSLPSSIPQREIRVLVMGGDEVQAQYDEAIRQHYRTAAPWLQLEFIHTGWSSNWSEYVDEFERRLPRTDAVVMMYLMRTELGRQLRAHCTKPWRGCGGRGRASIQRAIDSAVTAVLAS